MNKSTPTKLPRLQRGFYRNGPSHRDGADVSFADIQKVFEFPHITIGRWVTANEQQLAANLFFDALCDLADILQVKESVLSLNQTLSLCFGSGGQRHSSAHYDPAKRQLALAKNAGGGALAHEWFHAFDHYICQKMFADTKPQDFASQAWLNGKVLVQHPLNQIMADFFATLFVHESAPNDYVRSAIQADRAMHSYYFARPQELAARAFEAIIQDHPYKNSFLVQGTKKSLEARLGVYPRGSFRIQLGNSLMLYFRSLAQALARQDAKRIK